MLGQPISTAEAAVYPWDEKLARSFVKLSRFEDLITLYRSIGVNEGRRLLLPRAVAPVGKKDLREVGQPVNLSSQFKPRSPEQARVIDETVSKLQNGESFVVQAPTGFGKTWCTMDIIKKFGRRVCIVVTKEDIKDQWIVAAEKVLGLKRSQIGVIQADKCNVAGKPLVIAMIQSISKMGRYPPNTFRGYGLIIWDEVHRVGADHFSNSAWQFRAMCRLGLSATPQRKDGKDIVIYSHIGGIEVTTEQIPLIPKVLLMKSGWQIPMVQRKDKKTGHYKTVELPHSPGKCGHINKLIGKNDQRNLKIARFVKAAYERHRNIIIFSAMRDHLRALRDLFVINGIDGQDIGYYVGGLTAAEREKVKGKDVILATYQMASEATDIPWMDTAVLAMPRSDVVQIVGRILREYPNKKQPIVLDLQDDSSSIFGAYGVKRRSWYKKIGAEVKLVNG